MRSFPELNDELADKLKHAQSMMCHGGDFHQKSYFEDKYKDRPNILQDVLGNAEQMWDAEREEMLLRDTKVGRTDNTVYEVKKGQDGTITACKAEDDGEEDGSPPAKKLRPGDEATSDGVMSLLASAIAGATCGLFCRERR